MKLDRFTLSYVETALWSSTDNDGEPLDKKYGVDDIAPETLTSMKEDCEAFQKDNGHLWESDERAGHDFWLTRNHHGAGFWDGDYPEQEGRALTRAAHDYGSIDLYIGDDGKIHS